MCNIPDNDTIYLLDNLGFSNVCTKKNDKYICNNVMYGKTPVLNTTKCVWEFCNTNIKTGDVDLSTCKETVYPYYVENANKGCVLKKLDNKDSIQTTAKDCCCNPDSLCDYTNCCDKVAIDKCDYKDFQGKFFNNTYD